MTLSIVCAADTYTFFWFYDNFTEQTRILNQLIIWKIKKKWKIAEQTIYIQGILDMSFPG